VVYDLLTELLGCALEPTIEVALAIQQLEHLHRGTLRLLIAVSPGYVYPGFGLGQRSRLLWTLLDGFFSDGRVVSTQRE